MTLQSVMMFLLFGMMVNCSASSQSYKTNNDLFVYYEKTSEGGYNCCMKYLPDRDSVIIGKLNELPFDALWDTLNKTVSFILTEGIYKCGYQNKTSLDKIGESIPENNEFGSAWIDSATNRIRISYFCSYSEMNNNQKKLYSSLRAKTDYLPSWGDSGIAYINQINSEGKWIEIASAATKTSADLTPGFNALDGKYFHKNNNVLSSQSLILNSTCHEMIMKLDVIRTLDTAEYRKFAIDQRTSSGNKEFKLIQINSNYDLIVSVFWGEPDSPHFTVPVYVVNKKQNKTYELSSIGFKQAAIYINSNYLILANEYDNSQPVIFSNKTFEIIYKKPTAEKAIIIGN